MKTYFQNQPSLFTSVVYIKDKPESKKKGSNLMKTIIFYIMTTMFIMATFFANIGAVGYGLYLWGSVGMTFAASTWTAFVLWLKLMGVSIVSFFGALMTKD